MRIFEFAAVYLPKEREGEKQSDQAKIIVQPTTVLAKDEKQAAMLAARALPEDYVGKLESVEIAVRPF